jgi:outer membrane protein TolC
VKMIKKIASAPLWLLFASFWVFTANCLAQTSQPERDPTQPRSSSLIPLPDLRSRSEGGPTVVPPLPTPPTILAAEVQQIDLGTALQLANVQNPEFNVARTRILEAAALRQLAAAYFLPSINPGMNYDSHTGNLQQSSGNILSVNRSALYIGAGSNAIAAGSVNIPGVYYFGNVGVGAFNYLASKQFVRQREFESIAIRNQVFLQVTWTYSELLRAEGRRAAQIQARDEAKIVVRLTTDFNKAGLGRAADANRAATQLARREADVQAAEAEILVASANLCRLLNLDPSIRLHPTDAVVVPQPIVPDPMPVSELIALGLLHRPELAGQQAAIRAALLSLDGAKILPFSPTTIVGFSGGAFGGGSNLVRPIFGGLAGRTDLDAIAYWTIQNLGVGNIALIRLASARLKMANFQQVEILNRVRADVAEAYARSHARYAQIGIYEQAVRSGYLAFHEDLERIQQVAANRPARVLPIELLNSFDLLANARVEYVDAIVDYNRAQFAMYVALGQPPANSLAHPVPVEGVVPRILPPERVPNPAAAPGNVPLASNAGGRVAASAPGENGATPPSARDDGVGAGRARSIPPPRDRVSVAGAAGS